MRWSPLDEVYFDDGRVYFDDGHMRDEVYFDDDFNLGRSRHTPGAYNIWIPADGKIRVTKPC